MSEPSGVREDPFELRVCHAIQPLWRADSGGGALSLPARQAAPRACQPVHGIVVHLSRYVFSRAAAVLQA